MKQFDLRTFLTENKITAASQQMLNEAPVYKITYPDGEMLFMCRNIDEDGAALAALTVNQEGGIQGGINKAAQQVAAKVRQKYQGDLKAAKQALSVEQVGEAVGTDAWNSLVARSKAIAEEGGIENQEILNVRTTGGSADERSVVQFITRHNRIPKSREEVLADAQTPESQHSQNKEDDARDADELYDELDQALDNLEKTPQNNAAREELKRRLNRANDRLRSGN